MLFFCIHLTFDSEDFLWSRCWTDVCRLQILRQAASFRYLNRLQASDIWTGCRLQILGQAASVIVPWMFLDRAHSCKFHLRRPDSNIGNSTKSGSRKLSKVLLVTTSISFELAGLIQFILDNMFTIAFELVAHTSNCTHQVAHTRLHTSGCTRQVF